MAVGSSLAADLGKLSSQTESQLHIARQPLIIDWVLMTNQGRGPTLAMAAGVLTRRNSRRSTMTTITQFIRTTVVGGLFSLAPFVVLIVIIAKALDYAKKALNALLVHIPAASDLTAGAATVLAVGLVALVCFLAGLLARSVPAKRMVDALESSFSPRW
jgi:hypothetical protein